MTREEVIKYFEQSLECMKRTENSDCDYMCKNCDVGEEVDLFDLCHSVIKILKENVMGGSVSLIDGHVDEVKNENICVCCGEPIPEGRQICWKCEARGKENEID